MDISAISEFHTLTTVVVSPKQLLLDPSNPRITVDIVKRNDFKEQELASEELQKEILRKINKNEDHVAELIQNIKKSGFIEGLGPFIVKKIIKTNKYLVLEGNRRTTALKHLLNKENELSPKVKKTLLQLKVSEFTYKNNDVFTEDEIIDLLLGTIHIKGPLAWGAMEKAHYIFNNYMRQYSRHYNGKTFKFNSDCVNKVCEIFPYKPSDVKKSLMVYRVYMQLKKNDFVVDTDRFTLIELSVSDQDLRDDYFEFDDEKFT